MTDATMRWDTASGVLAETALTDGYEIAQMSRDDVPQVTARLRTWYPDIEVGAESCHLRDDFYLGQTALEGGSSEPLILPLVVKHDGQLVGMITYERNVDSRTITSRMGALAADHRGSGLALLGPILLEKLGRAMGAELAYYFATLKTKDQQVLAERLRFMLVGIVPAFDRDMVRPGAVMRVHEAIYAKVLVGDDSLVFPRPEAMTRRTKAVWLALFGSPIDEQSGSGP